MSSESLGQEGRLQQVRRPECANSWNQFEQSVLAEDLCRFAEAALSAAK